MAATQVIDFSFAAQLDRGTTFPGRAFRDSAPSLHGFAPHWLDLLQGYPHGTALSSGVGGLCI